VVVWSRPRVGPILQSFGRVRAEVIEEGDGAALAAIEEEMQEVRMARRSPAARRRPSCKVSSPLPEYQVIESSEPLEFGRKELGLKPAVWYGLFTGGLTGRIEIFDRERVRIVPAD